MSRAVERSTFGTMDDGRVVEGFRISAGGLEVHAITYGATITSLRTPDRDGRLDDIVLGFDSLGEYIARSPYFGAVIGRCANRIAGGRFALDGEEYHLATNDGAQHLHGGVRGFDKMIWEAAPLEGDDVAGVRFTRTSAGGEEGYPGTLEARVDYTLDAHGALTVDYAATTDAATVVNLTQHSYFDLSGGRAGTIGQHLLTIHAESITPVDPGLIPTGELMPVALTPFDFRRPTAIGARVDHAHEQLRFAGGYDHNFVLTGHSQGGALVHAAHVEEPMSGRTLDVRTSEPGLQFYSGNFLDGSIRGRSGRVYGHRSGFCLETQHFPDSPNHPHFPSVVLRPAATYRSRTIYTFGTRRSARAAAVGG